MHITAWLKIEQRVGHITNKFAHCQALEPVLWDPVQAVKGAGKLAIDRLGSVSIVTQVHGTQRAFAKRIGMVKRPERSLKRVDHKPAADDHRRFLLSKRTVSDLGNCRGESMTPPIIPVRPMAEEGTQYFVFRSPFQRTEQQAGEIAARVNRRRCTMGGPGTSPALCIASRKSARNARGTGASRINEPFPAVNGSVEPANGSRVRR